MMNHRCAAAVLALAAAALSPCAAGQESMIVVRDPVTGQLRTPTAAELAALREQDRAMAAMPPIAPSVRRPDGTRHLHLGERGMVYSLLTRDPDGGHAMRCVNGAHAAGAALAHPAKERHERR